MQLEKFYVDVVSTDGSGCIGYAARLDGFGFAATIAATLRWDADPARPSVQQRTLRGNLPVAVSEGLTWHCPALALAGTWAAREPAGAETVLWGNARGAVRVQPLAPRAKVELHLAGQTIAGWGYAERLRLNLPPWRLPIDSLRWGRFVSPVHSAAWIEWEHSTPRRWLWHDGAECSEFRVAGQEISWPGGRVTFGEPRALRAGRLADTALARWPRVQRWLPKRIQALDESKWCAPATLIDAGNTATRGWVIHEHVRFR